MRNQILSFEAFTSAYEADPKKIYVDDDNKGWGRPRDAGWSIPRFGKAKKAYFLKEIYQSEANWELAFTKWGYEFWQR